LQIFVEHLFPAGGVDAGCIGDHTVQVEQHGIVALPGDRTFACGLSHRLPPLPKEV
jgi:hypothetical protein